MAEARFGRSGAATTAAVVLAALALQAVALWVTGRHAVCACGLALWSGDVLGMANSQQLSDWYTPSHVIHGLVFYWAVRLVRPSLSFAAALAVALAVEVAWELVENSPAVIEHYRAQALAQGYNGDSIVNSVSDTAFMVAGFFFAAAAPWWGAALVAVALEAWTGWMIRDGLALNVIQFIHPVDFIYEWQAGLGREEGG